MKIISVVILLGLLAFVGYQTFAIVEDFIKRKKLKMESENSDTKTD